MLDKNQSRLRRARQTRLKIREIGAVRELTRAGYRVIAIDNRGHGRSAKLHDPAAYGAPIMAEDARRLLDHHAVGQRQRELAEMANTVRRWLVLMHLPVDFEKTCYLAHVSSNFL